jgi:hypothetical protein
MVNNRLKPVRSRSRDHFVRYICPKYGSKSLRLRIPHSGQILHTDMKKKVEEDLTELESSPSVIIEALSR